MKLETRYTLNQLATVLSALDNQRRNPNTKKTAIANIGRAGETYNLTAEEILDTAAGLLDGRMDAAAFRKALANDVQANMAEADEPEDEPAKEPKTRYGTKQATLIEMMSRPEGATVDQLAAAVGWLPHTVRGAIAGAIKKKLGLTIITERVRGGDGARGAYTIYRIQPAKNRVQA